MTHEQKIRLGIFLSLATVLFLAVTGFFILPEVHEPGDVYFVDFRDTSVHGLYVGAPVKYRGVEIGKVTRMIVNPENLDSVLVYVKVRKGTLIKIDMRATLVYTGLTGQKYVELSGGSLESERLPVRGEIRTGRGLGEKAEDIVSSIETAVENLNALLSKDNQENFSAFLKNVQATSGTLSKVVESRRHSLEKAIAAFEKASQDLAQATGNLGPLTENLNRAVVGIETDSRATMANLTERFSDAELGRTIEETTEFLAAARETIKKLDGLISGKREEIDVLIGNLAEAADNLSRVSREISEDPSILLRGRKEKK